MTYTNPQYLIDAATLNAQLSDPNIRIFDAAVFLAPKPEGGYGATSGHDKYSDAHIPGAAFIDLIQQWANTSSGLGFTLPSHEELCAAIGASGISADNHVVLYSSGHIMWATRAWWLLQYAGHDNISVLDGSMGAWQAAGLPTEQGEQQYDAATFVGTERPHHFASVSEVEEGMDGNVCTINALSPALYEGTGDFYYQRRGHIPGSHSLFYDRVLTNEHFLPADQLTTALNEHDMLSAQRVITYCGGGIAATIDAFACALMGQQNVAVYDGSMSEWVQQDSRPLTVGSAP